MPKKCWQILSFLHNKIGLGLATLLLHVTRLLPMRSIAFLKERISCVGKLDYLRRDIFMRIDSEIQINRLYACEKEPETISWIESEIEPGDVFFDIGANVGAYSFVAWAATGGNCKIYAFEPSFSTYAALNHNILINNCQEKIASLQVALSDENKLFKFNYFKVTPGIASHTLGEAVDENEQPFQPEFVQYIPGYRMDDLIKQYALPIPNHIKIDVDGAEYSILQGALDTLANPSLRSVLIEVDEKRSQNGDITSLMANMGFRLDGRHLRPNHTSLANLIFKKVTPI